MEIGAAGDKALGAVLKQSFSERETASITKCLHIESITETLLSWSEAVALASTLDPPLSFITPFFNLLTQPSLFNIPHPKSLIQNPSSNALSRLSHNTYTLPPFTYSRHNLLFPAALVVYRLRILKGNSCLFWTIALYKLCMEQPARIAQSTQPIRTSSPLWGISSTAPLARDSGGGAHTLRFHRVVFHD